MNGIGVPVRAELSDEVFADLFASIQRDSIRGMSLLQPWASLMALKEKHVETRGQRLGPPGWRAIAASARWERTDLEMSVEDEDFLWAWRKHGIRQMNELPLGAIVAVGREAACIKTEYFDAASAICAEREEAFGNYSAGRVALVYDVIIPLLMPVPVKGSQGLYRLKEETKAALVAEVMRSRAAVLAI